MQEVKRQSHKLREDVCKIYIRQRTSIYPRGGDREEQQLTFPGEDAILLWDGSVSPCRSRQPAANLDPVSLPV